MRQPHEGTLTDAFHYVCPMRGFNRTENSVDDTSDIYDNTAADAVYSLQSKFMTLLMPQNRPWLKITLNQKYRERLQSALGTFLGEANQAIFDHLRQSNFYIALAETLLDGIAGGTGCISVRDIVGEQLHYMAVSSDRLYFLEDATGIVDTIFVTHKLTGDVILRHFGDTLNKETTETFKEKPYQKHNIIECQITRNNKTLHLIYHERNWEKPLYQSLSDRQSYIVWRWEKVLGEVWGNSPVISALETIKSLQKMMEIYIIAAEYSARGLWQTQDETMNVKNISRYIYPGGLVAAESPLAPVQFSNQGQVTSDVIMSMRQMIKELLFDIQAAPIDPTRKTPSTATEILARRDDFLAKVIPHAERMQYELLQPLAQQIVPRLMMSGLIPPIPDYLKLSLQSMGIPIQNPELVFQIDVDAAVSQAIQLQQATNDLQAIAQLAQVLGGIQPLMKYINPDRFIKKTLMNMNVSMELFNTPEEQQQLAQQEQQAQAQAQQQAQQAQMGQMLQQAGGVDGITKAMPEIRQMMQSNPQMQGQQPMQTATDRLAAANQK